MQRYMEASGQHASQDNCHYTHLQSCSPISKRGHLPYLLFYGFPLKHLLQLATFLIFFIITFATFDMVPYSFVACMLVESKKFTTWNGKEIDYDIQNALMTCSHESLNFCKNYYFLWCHWYPCFRPLATCPLDFKATLFALGGGVCDVCSPRFSSGATPANFLTAKVAAIYFPPHVKIAT